MTQHQKCDKVRACVHAQMLCILRVFMFVIVLVVDGVEYNAIRRTSFLSWFQACQRVRPPVLISQLQEHFQDRGVIAQHLLQARLHHLQ